MQSPPSYNTLPMPMPAPSSAKEETSTATSSGFQLAHDADVLIRAYLPPSSDFDRPLDTSIPLPVCVPQAGVNPKEQSGFVRGYNPDLNNIGIPQDVFLNFIDGLNMAITASPPLRVVDLAGKIIGLVPYHWAMIAGTAMQVSAGIAIHVLSKTLTDRFLRAANTNIFHPRGYSVRLCTTPAMLALCNNTESKARSKINKFGRGVGTVLLKLPIPVINPIASTIAHALADKPPPVSPTGREGDPIKSPVLMRRLAMTQNFALPLIVDGLPPPEKPHGAMETVASWGVRWDTARENRSEKNIERRRRALESIKQAGIEAPPSSRRLLGPSLSPSSSRSIVTQSQSSPPSTSRNSSFKGVASQAFNAFSEHRLQKEIVQEQREQQRNYSGRGGIVRGLIGQKTTMERKVADADLLEHWGTDKILWIVIMPSDMDAEISDIAIADDLANEERIDESTWRAEMELERDEMELDDMQELREQQDSKERRKFTSEQY